MSADKSQFDIGYQPSVEQQGSTPGSQKELNQSPSVEYVPTPEGGYQLYKAAGKLKDKRAIITGGDSGIGKATAVLFAMEGCDTFIVHLPEEEEDAKDTIQRVEKYGRKCYSLGVNLKDKNNCKKVIDQAVEKLGGIDILFNNHAYQMMVDTDITDLPEDQWVHTFETNINPFFYLSKYAIPHMKKGCTIINDASINAYIGRPDLLDYTSSKGAVVAFTYGLANQFVSKGIRVNAVAPGPVWTPLVPSTMTEEAVQQFTSPMGRPAQPSEIATCVVFLASTDSSQLCGQVIHCNGGVIVHG